jgi:hypothetical protein
MIQTETVMLGAKLDKVVSRMGLVIKLEARRHQRVQPGSPAERELPRMLSHLLAAGATDFTRVALDAWGKAELAPEEILELCTTYAAVAGLEPLITRNC